MVILKTAAVSRSEPRCAVSASLSMDRIRIGVGAVVVCSNGGVILCFGSGVLGRYRAMICHAVGKSQLPWHRVRWRELITWDKAS